MRIKPGTPQHVAFRNDVITLLRNHAGKLDGFEMLALASQLVGQIVAMQDQRKVTPDMAMETVKANIEAGNQMAAADLNRSVGGKA